MGRCILICQITTHEKILNRFQHDGIGRYQTLFRDYSKFLNFEKISVHHFCHWKKPPQPKFEHPTLRVGGDILKNSRKFADGKKFFLEKIFRKFLYRWNQRNKVHKENEFFHNRSCSSRDIGHVLFLEHSNFILFLRQYHQYPHMSRL